jgi:hypothetical protein
LFQAVVRISGAGRLADCRERLRWLMVRDMDAEAYTEHHGEGVLEYRFEPLKGIPFPAFTEASAEFPELRVEAEWDRDGVKGRALIENGRLVEQDVVEPGAPGVEVEIAGDAILVLGMACAERDGACIGYAACAGRHTYFRHAEGKLELLGTEAAPELEEIAFGFIDEWIWFDETEGDDAAVERVRYEGYGYPVRGANLKSKKLALLREKGGRLSTLNAAGRAAREALVREWLTRNG